MDEWMVEKSGDMFFYSPKKMLKCLPIFKEMGSLLIAFIKKADKASWNDFGPTWLYIFDSRLFDIHFSPKQKKYWG